MPSASSSPATNALARAPKMLSGAASGVARATTGSAPRARSSVALSSASSQRGNGQLGPLGLAKASRGAARVASSSISARNARTSPGPRNVSAPGTEGTARAPMATSSTS